MCDTTRHGKGSNGIGAGRAAGHSPAIKRQIVEMALHASGMRETARVLHVSPSTVLKELKNTAPPAGASGRGATSTSRARGG